MQILTNFLGSILRFIYQSLVDLGNEPEIISYYAIALIVMAFLQKIVTIPLTLKAAENSKRGMELQPEINKIMDKYKNDPENQNRKLMEFYKENDYKPGGGCGGCLVMLIPLIIIWGMLSVIRNPETYIVVKNGAHIAKNFFWIPDLSQPDPYMFGLPILYSLSMFAYTSLTQQSQPNMNQPEMEMTGKMMRYFMPVMMFFFSRKWAAGIILFWTVSNIIEIIVRLIIKFSTKAKEA